jgi:hypothetical protein
VQPGPEATPVIGTQRSVSPGRQDASGSRAIRAYRALVPAVDDLAALPRDVAESAQVDANGGVWWHSQDAERAVNAPADAWHVILGLEALPLPKEDF